MKFARKPFFDGMRQFLKRRNVPGGLNQSRVDNLEQLLTLYETYYGWWDFLPQIANSLAQVYLESAHSFGPVDEGFWLPNKANFQQGLRYYPYFGRGHIQLTWRENYQNSTNDLKHYFPELVAKVEADTGQPFDLVKYPGQAMIFDVSFAVMTVGMHKGRFRDGHTLDRYINPSKINHFGAREIVNGDKNYKKNWGTRKKLGVHLTDYALELTEILEAALIEDDGQVDEFNPSIPVNEPPTDDVDLTPAEDMDPGKEPDALDDVTADDIQHITNDKPTVIVKESPAPPAEPKGDPPQAPPKTTYKVEDYKPFVSRWLKRIWAGFTGLNGVQVPMALTAATQSPKYAPYFLAAGGIVLIITLLIVLAGSVVLGVILFRNRKELNTAFNRWIDNEVNPDRHNYDFEIVEK